MTEQDTDCVSLTIGVLEVWPVRRSGDGTTGHLRWYNKPDGEYQ